MADGLDGSHLVNGTAGLRRRVKPGDFFGHGIHDFSVSLTLGQ